MTKTVIALYDEMQHANLCLRALLAAGFEVQAISLVAPLAPAAVSAGPMGLYPRYMDDSLQAADSSAIDEMRRLTGDLDAIKVPGIGPVMAAGLLASELNIHSSQTFSGVDRGLLGGLLGALTSVGVPEERAHYYAEGVRRGSTLLMLKMPDYRSREAVGIVNRYQPVDLKKRAGVWRLSGWTGFKPV